MDSIALQPHEHPTAEELSHAEIRRLQEKEARIPDFSQPRLFLEDNFHLSVHLSCDDKKWILCGYHYIPTFRQTIQILARPFVISSRNNASKTRPAFSASSTPEIA